MVQFKRTRVFTSQPYIERAILDKARQNKDIIFGAQSIKKQIGVVARPTEDFDIFTAQPKKSAMDIEKKADKLVGFDYFFLKKGMNPGTWKVKSRGLDLKKGTQDDMTLVDYTKTPRIRPKIIKINGLNYRKLSEERKAKLKTQKDKKFAFRKEKDRGDLDRIRIARRFKLI